MWKSNWEIELQRFSTKPEALLARGKSVDYRWSLHLDSGIVVIWLAISTAIQTEACWSIFFFIYFFLLERICWWSWCYFHSCIDDLHYRKFHRRQLVLILLSFNYACVITINCLHVGSGMESKLNHAVFKQRVEVLRRYVGKVNDRELQVLNLVQTLLNKCQHPEGAGVFCVTLH